MNANKTVYEFLAYAPVSAIKDVKLINVLIIVHAKICCK